MDGLSKISLRTVEEFENFAESCREGEVSPPTSFPCVGVWVLVEPEWHPCYMEIEYVYLSDFEA